MRDLRRENLEDWWEVTDVEIDEVSKDKDISEKIVRLSQNLILMRKRAFDRVLELFPNIKTQSTDWAHILQTELSGYNENELKNHIFRTALIRKLVYRIFPQLRDESPSEIRDFNRIFHDKDTYIQDDQAKERFTRIHKNYVSSYHQVPDRDDIDFILTSYAGASNDRKKQILSELWVVLTIREAYELWLIGAPFLESFAEQEMGEAYTHLDTEQKKSFIRGLAVNETLVISAKDFNPQKLGEVISNAKTRRALAQDIYRSVALDVPETIDSGEKDIIRDIRKKKQKEAEEKWLEEENYDVFDAFVDELAEIKGSDGTAHIKNLKLLKTPGCVIRFEHPENGIQYIRVKKVRDEHGHPLEVDNDKYGIELEWLSTVDGVIRRNENFPVSYDLFQEFLRENKNPTVLKSEEFNNLLVSKESDARDGKIFDARATELDPVSSSNIASKLDLLDPEGSAFWFEEGTSFIAPIKYEWKDNPDQDGVWMVKKLHSDSVDLVDPSGHVAETNLPLEQVFGVIASTPWFKRIAKIKDDSDMLKELKEFGLDSQAELKDGQLIVKETDDHGHEKEKKITCFESEKGGHIRMQYIEDGVVAFWEFDDRGNSMESIKKHTEKHGLDKKAKSLYNWKRMSYPAFLRYLEKEKLKATTKDIIVADAEHNLHGHDHAHAHMESSFIKRVMQWQNPATIWKGFEMIFHSIEHTLEKGAKLDAAKFALRTSRFLWLPDSINAQVYADVVNGSKEIIEKYENKIFGLPGPAGRLKCIHIVHNRDSRPEEVMSAINYMLKSYGQLYAEDIKHYQPIVNKHNLETADPGYFAFLDGFILTSKLGDLKYWREKAYEKAIGEMGTMEDHENEPTEEQLIHGLLKTIDGKWDEFPYAASVVKASGGPSGFEKNWKFEGFDKAYQKGKDQTQMVNAQGRLNKAVWFLWTHEIYKAIGAMEMVAGKTKEPEFQALPFIWAVGWFSKYASHTALQKLKGYAEQGMSFNAYAFLRNEASNNLYRDTVRLALKDMWGTELVDKFDKLVKRLQFDSNNKDATKNAAVDMMKFWQEYANKGLNDRLQWHNGWLTKMSRDGNETTKKYLIQLDATHGQSLKDNSIPGSEFGNDWFKEHGYQNLITAPGSNGLRSLGSMLNKIHFEGTAPGGRPMNEEHREKIWNYVKKYMVGSLRDTDAFLWDNKLQKEQYLLHRKELLHFLAEKLTARTIKDREANAAKIIQTNIDTYPYYRDLEEMWIDPHAVFDSNLEDRNAEADYQRWKSGVHAGGSISNKTIPSVRDMVQRKSSDTINSRTPADTIKPKAGPRMRRSDWNSSKSKYEWRDDDSLFRGGSGDAGGENGWDGGD